MLIIQFLQMMQKTYETGRVVITSCLGVTEGFKNGVSLHDLIFQVTL